MENFRKNLGVDKQYDAGTIAKKYATASIENAEKDVGRKFIQEKISVLPRASSVVDIGCGSGVDLGIYKAMGFQHLFGVDPSQKFIAEAKGVLGDSVELREGTFEDIPYKDGSFDVVVSRFAMHYARDISISLQEVARVLKPGGSFIAVISHPDADAQEVKDDDGNITIFLFKGSVQVTFPQHRMEEYFSPDFFQRFKLLDTYEYCGTEQDRSTNGRPNALGFVAVKK